MAPAQIQDGMAGRLRPTDGDRRGSAAQFDADVRCRRCRHWLGQPQGHEDASALVGDRRRLRGRSR